jgi:hypothetical protein
MAAMTMTTKRNDTSQSLGQQHQQQWLTGCQENETKLRFMDEKMTQ